MVTTRAASVRQHAVAEVCQAEISQLEKDVLYADNDDSVASCIYVAGAGVILARKEQEACSAATD